MNEEVKKRGKRIRNGEGQKKVENNSRWGKNQQFAIAVVKRLHKANGSIEPEGGGYRASINVIC